MKPNVSADPASPEGERDMRKASDDRRLTMIVTLICDGTISWTKLLEVFASEPTPSSDLEWSRSWLEKQLARKLLDSLSAQYSDRQGFETCGQLVAKLIDGPSLPPQLLGYVEDRSPRP